LAYELCCPKVAVKKGNNNQQKKKKKKHRPKKCRVVVGLVLGEMGGWVTTKRKATVKKLITLNHPSGGQVCKGFHVYKELDT